LRYEKVLGDCVATALFPIADGSLIPHTYLQSFLHSRSGRESAKANKRLKANLRKLGFLLRSTSTHDALRPLNPTPTCVFLVLHHEFAATAIRSVEMPSILANPFWRYLGLKSEDSLRQMLRRADHAGHLGKYVVADQLELVTPRYTLPELLELRIRV
jgi:hypothetical protein